MSGAINALKLRMHDHTRTIMVKSNYYMIKYHSTFSELN